MARPRVLFSAFLILGLTLSCGPQEQVEESPAVQIDHVILAVSDLRSGMDRLEELTGVRPVFGGDHPGRGTRNALLSLGPRVYLELLAPQEGVELPEDAAGILQFAEPKPWGWAASSHDLEATLERLVAMGYETSDPQAGSRATPDGGLLEWTAGMAVDPVVPGIPFFIEWGPDSPHPATTSPQGCVLVSLTVMTPELEAVSQFLDALALDVEVEAGDGEQDEYEVALDCPSGRVVFR